MDEWEVTIRITRHTTQLVRATAASFEELEQAVCGGHYDLHGTIEEGVEDEETIITDVRPRAPNSDYAASNIYHRSLMYVCLHHADTADGGCLHASDNVYQVAGKATFWPIACVRIVDAVLPSVLHAARIWPNAQYANKVVVGLEHHTATYIRDALGVWRVVAAAMKRRASNA